MPRVLVDVTQLVNWPATTGVQRVLRHLAENWRGDEVRASFGFIDGDAYVIGTPTDFASVVRARFEQPRRARAEPDPGKSVFRDLHKLREDIVPIDRIGGTFSGYLLAEPSMRADILTVLTSIGPTSSVVPFVMYYDALPLTHPQFFRQTVDEGGRVTRYHRAVARIENVAFISEHTRRVFETRIARRRLPNALVVQPGADALTGLWQTPPDPPRFTVVGTIEPRKRHALVLDVFERLWNAGRQYELLVLGPAGSKKPILERLERLSESDPLRWITDADDKEILEALSRSTALLFLSEAEGYGLPPMEALSVGCPVIVSRDLPALEGIAPAGQIRLRRVSRQQVNAAVEMLADPILNAQYRASIHSLELPTWGRFAHDIEHWVAERLNANSSRLVA
jgi:glycosyltransferase involved in cell wall biosynthesis